MLDPRGFQVFEAATGAFLRSFGSKGSRPGDFRRPGAIAISRGEHLLVAELTGRRLQVLTLWGAPRQVLKLDNLVVGGAMGPPVRLGCLAADDTRGLVYAAESSAHSRLRILRVAVEAAHTRR